MEKIEDKEEILKIAGYIQGNSHKVTSWLLSRNSTNIFVEKQKLKESSTTKLAFQECWRDFSKWKFSELVLWNLPSETINLIGKPYIK